MLLVDDTQQSSSHTEQVTAGFYHSGNKKQVV
jgi:hypothetical protein